MEFGVVWAAAPVCMFWALERCSLRTCPASVTPSSLVVGGLGVPRSLLLAHGLAPPAPRSARDSALQIQHFCRVTLARRTGALFVSARSLGTVRCGVLTTGAPLLSVLRSSLLCCVPSASRCVICDSRRPAGGVRRLEGRSLCGMRGVGLWRELTHVPPPSPPFRLQPSHPPFPPPPPHLPTPPPRRRPRVRHVGDVPRARALHHPRHQARAGPGGGGHQRPRQQLPQWRAGAAVPPHGRRAGVPPAAGRGCRRSRCAGRAGCCR